MESTACILTCASRSPLYISGPQGDHYRQVYIKQKPRDSLLTQLDSQSPLLYMYIPVRLILSFLPLGGLSGVNLELLTEEGVPGGVGLVRLPRD